MNEIVNKLLLVGDTLMPEMNLTQCGFTYCACEPFTKNKVQTTKIQRNRRFKIYLSKRIK